MRKRIILLIALLTVVLAFASCKNKTKYTVSVKLAEGEQLIGSITTKVGKKVLIGDVINETSVQKEGHIFKGWSIDGSSLVDKQLVITEDILLIPLFEVNSYKIKYTIDGEVFSEELLKYGSKIEVKQVPEKTGYTFKGWDKELPNTMPARLEQAIGIRQISPDVFYGKNCSLIIKDDFELELSPMMCNVLVKRLPRKDIMRTLRNAKGFLQTAGLICDKADRAELPDLKGREEILKVHAKKIALAPGVDFSVVARMASGASGAELANIVNEAALRAVRAGRKSATQADLEESIEVVIAGYQKKNSILTDKEKCIVAYHEIGHALVAAKQTHSAPVQKITIIPRTSGALGFTMQVEEGNHYLMDKTELENKIATLTGGRAAEEVAFGSITTGASNDIEQATKLARAMLTRYGMSDEFDMVALETVNNQYLGGDTSLACSAQTQREIDQKVVELVRAQHQKAIQILTDNRQKLDELAKYLYQKETITGDEFMEILERE